MNPAPTSRSLPAPARMARPETRTMDAAPARRRPRPSSPLGRARALLAGLGVALALALLAAPARAVEIVYEDPETCERKTVQAESIESETWTEVAYKESGRSGTQTLPTAFVVEIRRDDAAPEARRLQNAIRQLERGQAADAARTLKALGVGGYTVDVATGERTYQSFTANDPPGRGRRPTWSSEYAHYFYARARYEQGVAEQDRDALEEALLAVDDLPVPGVAEATRSGGFLGRFEGGNSRWYPHAMLLKAEILLALGRYDEATQAFEALQEQAISVGLGPRWAYEAQIGAGRIEEAQGNALQAINQYKDAASFMKLMLRDETRPCGRLRLGRYHSLARMHAAAIMLDQAEESRSGAEFEQLRRFIQDGMPDAIRNTNRTLPPSQLDALVAGAMDPRAQAVAHNGLGLAHLQQRQFEDAILHFRAVEVRFFEDDEEHARALHYLAQAAENAAQGARSPEAKALYETIRKGALERLRADHPDSRWARGG